MSDIKQANTILQLVNQVEEQLEQAQLVYGQGTESASDESVFIVLSLAGLEFDCSESELENAPTAELVEKTNAIVTARIKERIPAAYLLNKAWFCGLSFYVDERVLIPRSPFAELILNRFYPWIPLKNVNHILEIGTGSACMAIAAAYAFPDAVIHAVDIDKEALEVARINIQQHQLEERVILFHSDVYDALPDQQYDVIMANPPYVSEAEMIGLEQEFQHEPAHALQAEENGMAVVDKILHGAVEHVNIDGILIGEVGYSQDFLIELYPDVPFTWLEFEFGGEGLFMLNQQDIELYF